MLNIIKMDLYKMFKSKSFYVLNITLIVIVLFMALLMRTTLTMDFEKAKQSNISFNMDENTLSTNDPSLTEEEYKDIQKQSRDQMNINEFLKFQYSEFLISTLIAIFIAGFICSELDSGFIKNIIPLKDSRAGLAVSKNIVAILFILTQAGISLIFSGAANLIVSGKVNVLDSKELIIYLGLQILLRIAFASLITLISYLFKSKAAAMSIGIILSVNAHGLFLNILDKVSNLSKLKLSQLSIINNTAMVEFSHADYQRIILISLAYFIIYNIINTIRVRKLEIN